MSLNVPKGLGGDAHVDQNKRSLPGALDNYCDRVGVTETLGAISDALSTNPGDAV